MRVLILFLQAMSGNDLLDATAYHSQHKHEKKANRGYPTHALIRDLLSVLDAYYLTKHD